MTSDGNRSGKQNQTKKRLNKFGKFMFFLVQLVVNQTETWNVRKKGQQWNVVSRRNLALRCCFFAMLVNRINLYHQNKSSAMRTSTTDNDVLNYFTANRKFKYIACDKLSFHFSVIHKCIQSMLSCYLFMVTDRMVAVFSPDRKKHQKNLE